MNYGVIVFVFIQVEKVINAGSQPEKSSATKGFDAFLESIDAKKKVFHFTALKKGQLQFFFWI